VNPEMLLAGRSEVEQLKLVCRVGYPYPLDAHAIEWALSPVFLQHKAQLGIEGPDRDKLVDVKREMAVIDIERKGRRVTQSDCEQYLLILSKHHLIHRGPGRVGRWLINPLRQEDAIPNISNVLAACATGDTADMGWRSPMRAGWACINAGLPDHALAIWTWLLDISDAGEEVAQGMFEDVCGIPRFRLSTCVGLATTYRMRREVQAELETRAKIRELWDPVYYSVGRNRIVESAIEEYRIDPTDERKETAIDLFSMLRRGGAGSATEGVREGCLVALMMARYVFGSPLAEFTGIATVATRR